MTDETENKPVLGKPFVLGRVMMTQGIAALIKASTINPTLYLHQHIVGDWGDVCEEDWAANNEALENESRLFSVYRLPDNNVSKNIWIITEWDRSVTTLLLPSEY